MFNGLLLRRRRTNDERETSHEPSNGSIVKNCCDNPQRTSDKQGDNTGDKRQGTSVVLFALFVAAVRGPLAVPCPCTPCII
jgi:hypothetical protein